MNKYIEVLKAVSLFNNIYNDELLSMLACLDAKVIRVLKNEYVLCTGNPVDQVGIVLAGQLHIIKEDIDGERAMLAALTTGDFFGEALCCAGVAESPVSVLAETDATVMLLKFRRVLQTCSNSCSFHTKLIANMLQVIAQKNLQLQARMDFLGKKSIRARLLSYFESIAAKQGSSFSIPFNREGLAEFLCIDRSALSRVLASLRQEGVIEYKKNRFTLL